jgi:hypothetical protein
MNRLTDEQWERIRDHFQGARSGAWIHHEVRLVQLLRVAFE